jgi:hypothetical protein
MAVIDVDQFEERAAWLEYCDGMSRFEAETEAARRQGVKRWEALQECRKQQVKS